MQSSKSSVRTFARLSTACLISLILSEMSFATDCASIITNAISPTGQSCECQDAGFSVITTNERSITSGVRTTGAYGILECANASDIVCSVSLTAAYSTNGMKYFKNTLGTDYFKCDWTSGSGFTGGATYIPIIPVNAPIDFSFNHKQPETYSIEIEVK